MSFEAIKDDALAALDNMKVGMKMDLFDQKKKKWQPAVVRALDRRQLNLLFLTIALDGYSQEFDESLRFPNERLEMCGVMLTDRKDCDPEEEEGGKKKKKEKKALKICFT